MLVKQEEEKTCEEDYLGLIEQFLLYLTRGIYNNYESVQAGITSFLLSIALGYCRTQIKNLTFIFALCNCGLFLRKYITSDKPNIVLMLLDFGCNEFKYFLFWAVLMSLLNPYICPYDEVSQRDCRENNQLCNKRAQSDIITLLILHICHPCLLLERYKKQTR